MEEEEAVSMGSPASPVVREGLVGSQTFPPVEGVFSASQELWVLGQELILGEEAEA